MILGIDTSIGTAVALVDEDGRTIAERSSADTRGHAEAIGGLLAAVLADAGHGPEAVTAVAAGMGPGPFTGLRVGIAAARAFAAGRGIPVLPVPSHAAVAAELAERGETGRIVIVTDARRREHYWTVVDLGAPGEGIVPGRGDAGPDGPPTAGIPSPAVLAGPGLTALDQLVEVAGIGDDVPRHEPTGVSAAALARCALRRRAAGDAAGPQQPLYLREPDVTPSKGPKRVTG